MKTNTTIKADITIPADGKTVTMALTWTDKGDGTEVRHEAQAARGAGMHAASRAAGAAGPACSRAVGQSVPAIIAQRCWPCWPLPLHALQRTTSVTDPLLAAQGRIIVSVDNQASLTPEDEGQAVSLGGPGEAVGFQARAAGRHRRPSNLQGLGGRAWARALGRVQHTPGGQPLPSSLCAPPSCLQLIFSVTNDSPKQVFLRLLGERSLTFRDQGLPGGRVTVRGRGSAPPVIASLADGIVWAEAEKEKVLILPEQIEWNALALKAGTA